MTFDEFEALLREALTHVYDPLYRLPDVLSGWIPAPAHPTRQHFQDAVLAAIEHLKPAADTPPNARSRRLYELLAYRYVQELTQEETAARLGITPRHLRREQQAAVQLLAQSLWRTQTPVVSPAAVLPRVPDEERSESTTVWRAQVQQEVAALVQNDPGAVVDAGVVLEDVCRLIQRIAVTQGVTVETLVVGSNAPLTVQVHPSLLRQLVIIAVQKLLSQLLGGQLCLRAEHCGERVEITVSGAPMQSPEVVDSEFMRETLTAIDGHITIDRTGDRQTFCISLPYQPPVTVLVVDDNRDLVHFYRRYVEHTRYTIIHTAQGSEVFDLVTRKRPDVLVLDVMLPDIDGWEVLTRLYENPATRSLPVIICSVVRQEELALALGATAYLVKPVRRQDFIQALDQVSARASAVG